MKHSKLTEKTTRVTGPYDTASHKTERTGNQKFVEWINQIVKEKHLPLGIAEQETVGADRKQPDVVLYDSQNSEQVLCLIELKPPYFSPFDDKELKEPARQKATNRKAKYFATSNFQWLVWFNTEKVNRMEPEEKQVVDKFYLSGIEDLDDIEDIRFKNPIIKGIERFLEELIKVHTGITPEPLLPIDEFLIFRLQEKIYRLARHYKGIIRDKAHKDAEFSRKLKNWFIEQQWAFTYSDSDFEKAARQTAYLLINKILFYDVLQSRRSGELDVLTIPDDLTKGGLLQTALQGYFDYVLNNIDYETIYSTDFIDQIAFPDKREVVEEIKELIKLLKRYDFSKIGFDIIGRIFEQLIPQEERHNLGQYFTSPDVVDLILKFCIKQENDKILDPSCGAGTFLVRAYQHKRLMNLRKTHQEILKTLWGVDIAKFPAHLSTINLTVNDLSVDENYPQILNEDFFNLSPMEKMGGDEARKKSLATLNKKTILIPYPTSVDCIVGNPPYTRQEEITEITETEHYKENLIEKALYDGKYKLADISKRAGIHAYFFVHGTKFLKDGGRFGFIVSNSWMDVDYGKGLQELFLTHYKIIAVIESKVERWFEQADVNTCIIILEKCKDQKQRDENIVRFVYLFKPLRTFIPPAQDIWEKQKQRLDAIDDLIKTILYHNDFYQNDELRIYPKKQKDLWEEGFDAEGKEYVGAKWGKYIRAPEIFFKILEKGKDKLVPLKDIADVRFGIKTGANEFFYLTEEEIKARGIEKEFWMHKDDKGEWVPNYIIKSSKECKSISVNREELKFRVLMIHKDKKLLDKTNISKWIKKGESEGFHERPTCSSRGKQWYNLGIWEKPDFVWSDAYNVRFAVYETQKTWADKRFFFITVKDKKDYDIVLAFLNSTIIPLLIEISGITNLGEGAVYTNVYWLKLFRVPTHKNIANKKLYTAIAKLKTRKIFSIFEEIGSNTQEDVSLDKVKPDRRELDKIIMGDILGLTEDEQLQVYRAVVDLVRSRIEKARSFGKKSKTKDGIDVDLLTKTIKEKIGDNLLGNFYREKVLTQKDFKTVKLFHSAIPHTYPPDKGGKKGVEIKNGLFGWQLSSGKDQIDCQNEVEAEYLKVWIEAGLDEIKVPTDASYLSGIVPELKALKERIDQIISDHISSITNQKLQHKILQKLQGELF
jgi:type I restriction-modification system DNA methylase subunit